MLGGLFGSKKDSLVADSPPSFGYESPYYKGHPSYKSPGLRTADFVYGWDDNPDFKRYLDDVRRIKSGQTPGIVGTDTFSGSDLPLRFRGHGYTRPAERHGSRHEA